MSLQKKTINGIIWSFIQRWFGQLISTAVFLLLARLLGPETFGLTAMASVFMAFMSTFLDQGFAQAIIQREELEPEHLDTAFWISVGVGAVLTVIAISVAEPVATLFGEAELEPIIRWISLNILLVSLQSVQTALLSRKFAFKALAVRSLTATFMSGVVSVIMAFQGFGVWSLVAQQLVNQFVLCLMLWTSSDWRPGLKVSSKHFKELFSFGINVMGLNAVSFFNRRSDDFLIGYFLGPVALGYYTVAYRLLLIMINLLTSATTQVALPAFSRLSQEPDRLRRAFYTATQFTSVLAFPAFLGMAVLAPELIKSLFGDQWLSSIPVMQVLSLVGVLHSVTYFNGTIMKAMGKPSWNLLINSINAVINTVSFLLVVQFGILAVASVFVVNGYLLCPIAIGAVYKLIRINIRTYFQQYLTPLIGSLAMIASIIGTKYFLSNLIGTLPLLAISSFIGCIVYILAIYLTDAKLTRKIIDAIKQMSPTKKTQLVNEKAEKSF